MKQHTLPYSHIRFAHEHWKPHIKLGALMIDATCGNGNDTLYLAQNLVQGHIYAFDIQKDAIESTKTRLKVSLPTEKISSITFVNRCHSKFPDEIKINSVSLIVYNLGYLPKGNESLTTQTKTTLESIKKAQSLLTQGGLISITCYPGHPEGAIEQKALLDYLSNLSSDKWSLSHYQHKDKPHAPSVIFCLKL